MTRSTTLTAMLVCTPALSFGCGGLVTTPYGDTGSISHALETNHDNEEASPLNDDEPGYSDDDPNAEDESDDDGSTGGGSSWGSDEAGAGAATGGSCTQNDFAVAIHQATQNNQDPTRPWFLYQARTTDTSPFTELQIMSFQADPYFGPSGPGTFDLSGLNYTDCALCMLVLQECDDEYYCDKGFFIESGTLQVNQMNQFGGSFNGSLINARFVEVTIDPETYQSTPVPGGESWCVDRLDIDVSAYLLE